MQGELRIMDGRGHTTIEWDTEVSKGPLDPAYAEAEFTRLIKDGHLGFGTTETGENVQLKRFDPSYPKVTLSPRFVGG